MPGVAARTRAAERAGFDYVSIQDHPYVPAFLDTLGLIAYLAGQTERLRFMSNVANLPLRPAPMLTINFVPEQETAEQIQQFGETVIPLVRESFAR